MRVLSIAATGMSAQQTNVEVIANNIANANTTGFKRSRAEFTDLLYQLEKSSSVPSANDQNLIPEGAQLGLGGLRHRASSLTQLQWCEAVARRCAWG